ncbi:MAG: Lpg1974 family pore-forming outer membrane protein, partial [Planctomycetota bacterium]
FLGYRVSPDAMIRFSYMNLAATTAVLGTASGNFSGGNGTIILGPYATDALGPGGTIRSTMEMNIGVYDLEIAKRLDLAPETTGEPPLWDTAWGLGLRFTDYSLTTTVDNQDTVPGAANILVTTARTFHGVGPRVALQGRRYLGVSRRWSAFATAGGSLVIGNYQNTDTRLTQDSTQAYESQQVGGTLLVPNLDLSLGGSWQMGPRTSFSCGWMLMYWGELGYAETINTLATPVGSPVTSVVLTNSSLSLDGVFFRLTHNF